MDEEIKTGEMQPEVEDGDDSLTIEEDYTVLESDTVIVDDDSNTTGENDALYEQAVEYKETLDDVKAQLVERLTTILEKGEISQEDSSEIELLQQQYTENYTALQTMAIENGVTTNTNKSDTSDVISNATIDYDKLMEIISEKADWLYIDEDGQIMLNGEAVPKLKVMELEAETIRAEVGEFKDLTAENFTAVNAKIDNLEVGDLTAVNAEIENLKANKADIENLNATNANITNLTALVAEIQTLVGGNLTMDNIQSLVLTSDKVTIANALIKDAMIETVSANKINTGTINTNNVSIQSEDGSMLINGTTQQFKDENNVVRIQIGKDATGNFTFALFSQDGQGILIDADGIKSGAVPDGLIVNDMVSDTANISGGKLDISSVISSINDNVNTLNSSKIKFDDTNQTLDVAFNQLKTKVETIENVTIDGDLSSVIEQVTTNTTNISIAQGKIDSLISNTTITKEDGTVTQLKDEFNSVKDTVSSHTQTINSLETNYKSTLKTTTTEYYVSTSATEVTGGSWVDTSPTWTEGKYIWQRMKYTYTDNSVTYSTAVCIQGTKGEQGIQGETGATGEKGQSLTKSTPQWYASTSNTTQSGGSWVESMPTIDSSHYLWLRYKLDWENPTATTYTTPTLEQIAESVKEVSAKQSEFTQDLNGFKMTVSETYSTKDELADTEAHISTVEQTAEKINWVVGSGTNKSDMTLTEEAYNLISNNVTINAEHINLNGYVSNDETNWSIDIQGNIEAKNLSVEDELSTDVLNVNKINNPKYPSTLSGDIDLYINSTTGSDDYSLDDILQSYDETEEQEDATLIKKFYSLRGVEAALPRNLNGKTVRIYLETDDNGQILFKNFVSGRILIFLCSHEVKGYIGSYNCYSDFKIYGGSNQNKPTTFGVIRPSTATCYTASDNSSVFIQKSPASGIYYCDIYGGSSTTGSYHCIKVTEDCMCRIDNCNFYSAYCFVNVSSLSQVFANTTTGRCTNYAFKSYTGSIIHLSNTKQASGTSGNAYSSDGSIIYGNLAQTISGSNGITWDGTSTVIDNTTTTAKTTTATATYKSTLGDTYRSTVYNNWKKGGDCRQGDWGYGDCTGVWFFGNQFAALKGKTITKVTITISRQSSANGNNSAVEHRLWMHNYTTRPSGAPTLNSAWSTTFTLTRGQSRTITITDSTVLNAISAGTCKGFAIRHSYDNSHYSVCSGSATVKITYQE